MSVTPAAADPAAAAAAQRVVLAPYSVELGPLGHLAAERERLAELTWEHFQVRRLGATIGAVIHGVDLTQDLADAVVGELEAALDAYKVVFFRDQRLTPAQHVALGRRFGELEIHPFIPANTGHAELVRFEKHAEVGGYENGWHSDVTWREVPSRAAILHAVQVPAVGGDTLFADMHAAYQGLDPALRLEIEDLTAVHDYSRVFGHQVDGAAREEMRKRYAPVEHPLVCAHDRTGRRHLYANRFFVDHVVGLDPDQSVRLIDQLSRQAELPEYQCRFHWEVDSVAFWDNRAVQHYACSDYWPGARIMERAGIVGERPHR